MEHVGQHNVDRYEAPTFRTSSPVAGHLLML